MQCRLRKSHEIQEERRVKGLLLDGLLLRVKGLHHLRERLRPKMALKRGNLKKQARKMARREKKSREARQTRGLRTKTKLQGFQSGLLIFNREK